jgi:hypothetical protein
MNPIEIVNLKFKNGGWNKELMTNLCEWPIRKGWKDRLVKKIELGVVKEEDLY